jgi:hypothetical protein
MVYFQARAPDRKARRVSSHVAPSLSLTPNFIQASTSSTAAEQPLSLLPALTLLVRSMSKRRSMPS